MSFDHNAHYHRLLMRQVPQGCRTALDVGCGTGRFARRLARRGIEVEAIDPSGEVVTEARDVSGRLAGGGNPRFEQADVTQMELAQGHYDFISCLASIHHVPFSTVAALRDALAPGGVLVILGCYPEKTPADWAWSLVAVPVNAVARLAVAAKEGLRPAPAGGRRAGVMKPPVRPPEVRLEQIRREAAVLLPGADIRRLLFWRYLLVFHNNA